MRLRLLVAAIVAVVTNAVMVWAQAERYEYNGLRYQWPSANVAGQMQNNGSGVLSWVDAVPANLIAFTKNGACPAGWTEFTQARGRSIVGLVSGGTNGAQVGTALSNVENRAVGLHNHTGSASGTVSGSHAHSITDSGHFHSGRIDGGTGGAAAAFQDLLQGTTLTSFATTGISLPSRVTGVTVGTETLTVNAAGTTAGTNAPAVQLMACRKL